MDRLERAKAETADWIAKRATEPGAGPLGEAGVRLHARGVAENEFPTPERWKTAKRTRTEQAAAAPRDRISLKDGA